MIDKSKTRDNTTERIRQRAYGLFERRGKVDGFALDDWLQAETEIRGEKKPDSKPKRDQRRTKE